MRTIILLSALFIFGISRAQTNSEVRILPDFSGIKSSGSFDITLIPSDKNEITLVGEKESTSRILTTVKDGRLTIKPEKGFKKYKTIKIEIRCTTIEEINLFGSGDFKSELISVEKLKFSSSGSGDCSLIAECTSLVVNISGSGEYRLAGKATSINLKSFGSGNIHAFEMEAETITIESKGSGEIDLNAAELINGEAFGSGDIECQGGAKVEIQKQGSGTITTR